MHLALVKRYSVNAITPGEITFMGFVDWYRHTRREEPEALGVSGDEGWDVDDDDPFKPWRVDTSLDAVPLMLTSMPVSEAGDGSLREADGHEVEG